MLSGEHGVVSAYIFRELGIMPCASLAQAQQELQAGHLAFVPTGALAPALADLLALRGAWAAAHWRACWRGWPIRLAAARCS